MGVQTSQAVRAAGWMAAAALALAAPAYGGATYTWTSSAPHASEDFVLNAKDTLNIQSGSHTVRQHLDGDSVTIHLGNATLNLSKTEYLVRIGESSGGRPVWFTIFSNDNPEAHGKVWTTEELEALAKAEGVSSLKDDGIRELWRWADASLLNSTVNVEQNKNATINGNLELWSQNEGKSTLTVEQGATLNHYGTLSLLGLYDSNHGSAPAALALKDRSSATIRNLWLEGWNTKVSVDSGASAILNVGTLWLDGAHELGVGDATPQDAYLQFSGAHVSGRIGTLIAGLDATSDLPESLAHVGGSMEFYVANGVDLSSGLFDGTALATNTYGVVKFTGLSSGNDGGVPLVLGRLERAALQSGDLGINSLVDGYAALGSNPLLDSALLSDTYRTVASAVSAGQAAGAAAHNLAVEGRGTSLIMARAAGLDTGTSLVSGLSGGDGFGGTLGVWATPVYAHERGRDIRMVGLDTGYKADSWGGMLGMDYSVGLVRVGVAASLGTGDATSTGGVYRTRNDVDYGGISLYGSVKLDPIMLSASAGWLRTHNDLRQDNGAGTLESAFNSDLWSARVQAEYSLRFGGVEVVPNVGLEYARYRQPGFSGKLASSTVARHAAADMDIVNLPVGVRVRSSLILGGGVLAPELRLRVIPSVGDTKLAYRVTMPGSSGAAVFSSPTVDRVAGEAGGGLHYTLGRTSFGLDYDFQFSSHRQAHGLQAQWRYTF